MEITSFLSSLILYLFVFACLLILILVLKKLIYYNKLDNTIIRKDKKIFLIKVHANNERKEDSFKAFLETLHTIIPHGIFVSFELVSSNQFMHFYVTVPFEYASILTSQLYSQFPDIELEEVDDYIDSSRNMSLYELKNGGKLDFKTYEQGLEDFLKGLSAVSSDTKDNEEIYMQLILTPIGEKPWEVSIHHFLGKIFADESNKIKQRAYEGTLLLGYAAENTVTSRRKLDTIIRLFKQAKGSENELKVQKFHIMQDLKKSFKGRLVEYGDVWSTTEISSIYHFPYKGSVTSNIVNTTSKKAPAPNTLPTKANTNDVETSFFGEINYHNENIKFGIKRIDRRRHVYVVGKTGSGKSRLLELLLIADLQHNAGCCLIDPHGDLASEVIKYVPKDRINDVVYIDPSDRDFPIGFNPLERTDDYEMRQHLSTFFIAIFKKLFGYNWNPRMEHLVRYITLALLETPDSNILGISRMLSDTTFRQKVVQQIQDPVIKSFWTNEFPGWNEKYANEAVIPIMNKVGQFIANPIIRNMVGQNKNTLNFGEFMDNGKIVIINLSKGKLGEENTAFLGAMFITKIQQAALARARVPEDARRDFYFYVDEFQNFATDAFSSILSEARKYHLNLTIAHQYIAQLPEDVKATAFGNVGSYITFSVGGDDAQYLEKELSPVFTADDMINLNAREMYVKLSVDGKVTPPFSARTIAVPQPETDYTIEILEHSRIQYGKNRVAVENEINRWTNNDLSLGADTTKGFPEPLV